MQEQRECLPIFSQKNDFVEAVNSHQECNPPNNKLGKAKPKHSPYEKRIYLEKR